MLDGVAPFEAVADGVDDICDGEGVGVGAGLALELPSFVAGTVGDADDVAEGVADGSGM